MSKTLKEYLAMAYRMEVVEDKEEGGFVVSYPDLPGCITCGETVESAVANALDAKKSVAGGGVRGWSGNPGARQPGGLFWAV